MVVLDAHTGAVLAMVGGENYHQSQFNLATQGERQPGSSFKPFVLATALQGQRRAVDRARRRKPVTINADGRLWEVNNYEGEYLGPIDLNAGDRLLRQLGLLAADGDRRAAQRARHGEGSSGSRRKLKGYFAIGLGAEPATPLEMARAYTIVRRRRQAHRRLDLRQRSRAVVSEIKIDGQDVEAERASSRKPVLTRAAGGDDQPAAAGRRAATAPARRPQLPGRQVAGKTGTTENYGDAWFVGYTPQLVAAVWVGYPDKLVPMPTEFHGHPVAGGTFPALIWKAFMTKALDQLAPAAASRSRRPTTATRRP